MYRTVTYRSADRLIASPFDLGQGRFSLRELKVFGVISWLPFSHEDGTTDPTRSPRPPRSPRSLRLNRGESGGLGTNLSNFGTLVALSLLHYACLHVLYSLPTVPTHHHSFTYLSLVTPLPFSFSFSSIKHVLVPTEDRAPTAAILIPYSVQLEV